MAIGAAGILSVVLASTGLMAVYGLGLIMWLAWLGVVMLRNSRGAEASLVSSRLLTTRIA